MIKKKIRVVLFEQPFQWQFMRQLLIYKENEILTQKLKQIERKSKNEYEREGCHKSCQNIIVQISFLKNLIRVKI